MLALLNEQCVTQALKDDAYGLNNNCGGCLLVSYMPLAHGSGFSPQLGKGHVRLVYLVTLEVLDEVFDRIERFLKKHRGH